MLQQFGARLRFILECPLYVYLGQTELTLLEKDPGKGVQVRRIAGFGFHCLARHPLGLGQIFTCQGEVIGIIIQHQHIAGKGCQRFLIKVERSQRITQQQVGIPCQPIKPGNKAFVCRISHFNGFLIGLNGCFAFD